MNTVQDLSQYHHILSDFFKTPGSDKEWDQYKQLVYLDNESDNPEIPNHFWGVVLAVPNSVKEQYKHLCNRIT